MTSVSHHECANVSEAIRVCNSDSYGRRTIFEAQPTLHIRSRLALGAVRTFQIRTDQVLKLWSRSAAPRTSLDTDGTWFIRLEFAGFDVYRTSRQSASNDCCSMLPLNTVISHSFSLSERSRGVVWVTKSRVATGNDPRWNAAGSARHCGETNDVESRPRASPQRGEWSQEASPGGMWFARCSYNLNCHKPGGLAGTGKVPRFLFLNAMT